MAQIIDGKAIAADIREEIAAEAAASFLHSQQVPTRIVSTRHTGEAREAAVAALSSESYGDEVLVFAGETTVAVRGSGRGGRN